MKFSVFRLISLIFSFVIDSTLADRFRLVVGVSETMSGLGDRFVEETGGDDDDWTSESFSLSLELLLVNNVIERLMELNPEDEEDAASFLEFPVLSALLFTTEFEPSV
jgi:hypothetical protein